MYLLRAGWLIIHPPELCWGVKCGLFKHWKFALSCHRAQIHQITLLLFGALHHFPICSVSPSVVLGHVMHVWKTCWGPCSQMGISNSRTALLSEADLWMNRYQWNAIRQCETSCWSEGCHSATLCLKCKPCFSLAALINLENIHLKPAVITCQQELLPWLFSQRVWGARRQVAHPKC